jgi:phage baseplate assembly protein gpV
LTPRYFGKYKAKVVNVYDEKEERGRIRVNCPTVLGDDNSAWCEPCIPTANDLGGDFSLPQVGETVWVEFEEGDPNKPVYVGNWNSEKKTPLMTVRGAQNNPEAEPLGNYQENHNKTRIISQGKCVIVMHDDYMRIYFGDSGDSEFYTNFNECYLSRANGKMKFFSDNETTSLTRDDSIIEMTSDSTMIKKGENTITMDIRSISIEADQAINLKAKTLNIEGDIVSKDSIKAAQGTFGPQGQEIIVTLHKHSGVTSGTSNTGKPVPE